MVADSLMGMTVASRHVVPIDTITFSTLCFQGFSTRFPRKNRASTSCFLPLPWFTPIRSKLHFTNPNYCARHVQSILVLAGVDLP